eukprot:TRINITY_DN3308_c0_g1_i2.p1 TRINITY_DN3308_c0_g1~~TRINITY_DN3308_c0_g1_i2.p1  ORF type:complete len:333 (-),score=57.15 TRINITY_DN3308_c0_g1_i2:7-1005(-)
MRRPSVVFYVVLLFICYLFGLSFFLYFFLPILFSTVFSVLLRRFFFEKVLQLPAPPRSFVVVSGTSTGFGAEFVVSLAGKGLTVLAGVRKMEDGETLVQSIKPSRRKLVIPVLLDVTNENGITNLVEKATKMVEEENMNMFALVNNAGIQTLGPIEYCPIEKMREIFEVNVFGLHSLTRAFLPLLKRNKGSRIINIGSIAGIFSAPFMSIYGASKHAVEAYSDSLRAELEPYGIHVTMIEPGAFKTAIMEKSRTNNREVGEYTKRFAGMSGNGRKINFPSPNLLADQLERVLLARFPPARAMFGMEIPAIITFANVLPDTVITYLFQLILPQ